MSDKNIRKAIVPIMKLIPNITEEVAMRKVAHSMRVSKIKDPMKSVIFTLCNWLAHQRLEKMKSREEMLDKFCSDTGLTKALFSQAESQHNISLPKHLATRIKKNLRKAVINPNWRPVKSI